MAELVFMLHWSGSLMHQSRNFLCRYSTFPCKACICLRSWHNIIIAPRYPFPVMEGTRVSLICERAPSTSGSKKGNNHPLLKWGNVLFDWRVPTLHVNRTLSKRHFYVSYKPYSSFSLFGSLPLFFEAMFKRNLMRGLQVVVYLLDQRTEERLWKICEINLLPSRELFMLYPFAVQACAAWINILR